VTLYYYHHLNDSRNKFFTNSEVPEAKGINLAIDTQEDFDQAEFIMNKCKDDLHSISLKELVNLALQFKK
jgi:spore coat polysaccharide biosynthesis protein SpsF (cytidylyltransferase family)